MWWCMTLLMKMHEILKPFVYMVPSLQDCVVHVKLEELRT